LPCLIGDLPCCVLSLLGGLACGVLCLARYLSCLVGGLTRSFLGLPGRLPSGVLHALGNLSHLICDPAKRSATALAFTLLLLLASAGETTGESAHGVLCLARYLSCLVGDLPCCVLSLLGGLASSFLCLARYLSCLVGGLACCLPGGVLDLPCCLSSRILRSLRGLTSGPVLAGPVFHRLGSLYHVADDDTSVAARALHLREVYASLFCLAAGRVSGLDLALAPDLIRVQVGDVLLCLVDAFLHGGVVVHQLLKKYLEGFLSPTRDLVRQPFQRGTVLTYVLFEHLGRITEVILSQVHRPLLDLPPGFLDAVVQLLQRLGLSLGH
jgi:hypothetical protein